MNLIDLDDGYRTIRGSDSANENGKDGSYGDAKSLEGVLDRSDGGIPRNLGGLSQISLVFKG